MQAAQSTSHHDPMDGTACHARINQFVVDQSRTNRSSTRNAPARYNQTFDGRSQARKAQSREEYDIVCIISPMGEHSRGLRQRPVHIRSLWTLSDTAARQWAEERLRQTDRETRRRSCMYVCTTQSKRDRSDRSCSPFPCIVYPSWTAGLCGISSIA